MRKKVLISIAASLVATAISQAVVLLVRRARTEPPPVSPTVPRVEEIRVDDIGSEPTPPAGS